MVNYISSNTGTGIDTAVDRVQAVSGDLVGTSDTQTITNKTFTDTLTIDQNNNNVGLNIDHDGASGRCIQTNNAVEGNTYHLFEGTGGAGAKINLMRASGNVTAGDALFYVEHQGSSTTIPAQRITNAGTGNGLFIDQNGNGTAFEIDSEATTARAVYIAHAGAGTNGTGIIEFQLNPTTASGLAINCAGAMTAATDRAAAQIIQNHASSTANALGVRNDGTGNAIYVNQTGNSRAVDIRSTATSIGMLQIYSNVAHTGTVADALANVRQDSASATGDVLYLQNDGTGNGLYVTSAGDPAANRAAGAYITNTASRTTANQYGIFAVTGNPGTESTKRGVWFDVKTSDFVQSIRNLGTGGAIQIACSSDSEVIDFDGCTDGGTSHTTVAGSVKVQMPNGSTGYINVYT